MSTGTRDLLSENSKEVLRKVNTVALRIGLSYKATLLEYQEQKKATDALQKTFVEQEEKSKGLELQLLEMENICQTMYKIDLKALVAVDCLTDEPTEPKT